VYTYRITFFQRAKSSESLTIEFPVRLIDLERVITDFDEQLAQLPGPSTNQERDMTRR
jgi:hypothetical protein